MNADIHKLKCFLDNGSKDAYDTTVNGYSLYAINADKWHYVSLSKDGNTFTYGFNTYEIDGNTLVMYHDIWNVGRLIL